MFAKCCTLLGLVFLVGCGGVKVVPKSDPVEMTFSVTAGGKPVNDVSLTLLSVGEQGGQAQGSVAQGKLKLSVIPGTYTYFVSEGKAPAAFNAIPAKYHAGAMDRTFDVKEAGSIDLKLD
ncbi:MAG: hypothetical protein ACK56W_00395 [Pirellula sp.]|jgi:hypothetical protein